MSPPIFYDMDIHEWFAAMDGYFEHLQLVADVEIKEAVPPATSADFADLEAYTGPSKSIKT